MEATWLTPETHPAGSGVTAQSAKPLFTLSQCHSYSGRYLWKVYLRDWRKERPSRDYPTRDPSHIQSPNPDTIADANKSFLTGAWYGCLLRGSASAWQIQKWVLAAKHWTEHRVPNGRVRERTEGAEGVCYSIERTTTSINKTPQSSQGLNHQPKSTHGVTHGSTHTCSRECPCRASMGGEALGPVKARCPSVGEYQGGEAGVSGVGGVAPS
jgi:hypothetical protein